jgi:O-antigen ligase
VTESPRIQNPNILEAAVALHVATLLIGVSWAFGGNADWVRTPISIWASIGILISLSTLASPRRPGGTVGDIGKWTWPIIALNGLVLVSCLSPGFRRMDYGDGTYFMPLGMPWWRPSAARPELALRALWLFDGIYFSCFNVLLLVRRRTVLRAILAALVGNTLVLGIFGTVQKFVGSDGIYFGSVKSPQDYFFASFVYDNHWASFVILMLAACVGLTLRYVGRAGSGGLIHGPSLLGVLSVFLIGVTVPLSGARVCTLLMGILLILAVSKGTPKFMRAMGGLSVSKPLSGIILALVASAVIWAAWGLAGGVVQTRVSKAKTQISAIWSQGSLGSRGILYRDTWRMAHDRMFFGWGMGSYPSVFGFYNTQVSPIDHIPVVYHDAHSDWLQSFAELGVVGTMLLTAAIVLPALSLRRRRLSSIPFFLVTGCLLVGAYSWIEFPFGNVAVVLSWWVCFICAVQYVRLSIDPSGSRPPS